MIHAVLISLDAGNSYPNPKIFTYDEINNHGIPRLFDDFTFAFLADDSELILLNNRQINLVQLTSHRPKLKNNIKFGRISLCNNITYSSGYIVKPEMYTEYGIPMLFSEGHQLAFVVEEGLFICHKFGVAEIGDIEQDWTFGIQNASEIYPRTNPGTFHRPKVRAARS